MVRISIPVTSIEREENTESSTRSPTSWQMTAPGIGSRATCRRCAGKRLRLRGGGSSAQARLLPWCSRGTSGPASSSGRRRSWRRAPDATWEARCLLALIFVTASESAPSVSPPGLRARGPALPSLWRPPAPSWLCTPVPSLSARSSRGSGSRSPRRHKRPSHHPYHAPEARASLSPARPSPSDSSWPRRRLP